MFMCFKMLILIKVMCFEYRGSILKLENFILIIGRLFLFYCIFVIMILNVFILRI